MKTLIFDGNNLMHASFYAMANMRYMGRPTSIIYGMPNIIKGCVSQFKPDRVIICWDGARSKHRLQLVPEYKQGRKKFTPKERKAFEKQKATVKRMFKALGVSQVWEPTMEADDVIYQLTDEYSKVKGDKVIIVSNDKDFYQLINKRVKIYQSSKKRLLHHKNFERLFGFTPEQSIDYLCLTGDKSDNIPGYAGVGEKTAMKILKEHSSIRKYCVLLATQKDNRVGKIQGDKLGEVYRKNRLMIDLKKYNSVYGKKLPIEEVVIKPTQNIKWLTKLCRKYGIRTILENKFLKHFK